MAVAFGQVHPPFLGPLPKLKGVNTDLQASRSKEPAPKTAATPPSRSRSGRTIKRKKFSSESDEDEGSWSVEASAPEGGDKEASDQEAPGRGTERSRASAAKDKKDKSSQEAKDSAEGQEGEWSGTLILGTQDLNRRFYSRRQGENGKS